MSEPISTNVRELLTDLRTYLATDLDEQASNYTSWHVVAEKAGVDAEQAFDTEFTLEQKLAGIDFDNPDAEFGAIPELQDFIKRIDEVLSNG